MGVYDYSLKPDAPVGKAQGHDWDASYKDLTQVCRAIRGLPVSKAFKVMQAAIDETRAIPYVSFAKGAGHRSNIGGQRGRYPKKECRLMTKLLKNAVNNAVQNGLNESTLYVQHASANKQNEFRRYRPFWVSGTVLGYGKHATWANYVTARAEIVLRGKSSGDEEKTTKPRKAEKKPEEKPASVPLQANEEAGEEKIRSAPEKPVKPKRVKLDSTIHKPAPSAAENAVGKKK